MNLEIFLTILSSLIFLSFFVLYNKNILKGSIKPNIVSWGLFSLITLINSLSYLSFTGDLFKSGLAFTDCFTCIIITCLILFKGKPSKLNKTEWVIIILSIFSLLLWYILHSAVSANLLLQPAYILAFIPTYKNAWKNPQDESSLVWCMWGISFLITITVIILRADNTVADFINPSIALILHFGVSLLALRKTTR